MIRRMITLCFIVFLAGAARAILPPDASAREPQIRAQRQKIRDQYQERLVERQAEAVRAYERTRADIFTPPWLRGADTAGAPAGTGSVSSAVSEKAAKRNHRFLVSIVLLILIGGGAVWVRRATKEIDE